MPVDFLCGNSGFYVKEYEFGTEQPIESNQSLGQILPSPTSVPTTNSCMWYEDVNGTVHFELEPQLVRHSNRFQPVDMEKQFVPSPVSQWQSQTTWNGDRNTMTGMHYAQSAPENFVTHGIYGPVMDQTPRKLHFPYTVTAMEAASTGVNITYLGPSHITLYGYPHQEQEHRNNAQGMVPVESYEFPSGCNVQTYEDPQTVMVSPEPLPFISDVSPPEMFSIPEVSASPEVSFSEVPAIFEVPTLEFSPLSEGHLERKPKELKSSMTVELTLKNQEISIEFPKRTSHERPAPLVTSPPVAISSKSEARQRRRERRAKELADISRADCGTPPPETQSVSKIESLEFLRSLKSQEEICVQTVDFPKEKLHEEIDATQQKVNELAPQASPNDEQSPSVDPSPTLSIISEPSASNASEQNNAPPQKVICLRSLARHRRRELRAKELEEIKSKDHNKRNATSSGSTGSISDQQSSENGMQQENETQSSRQLTGMEQLNDDLENIAAVPGEPLVATPTSHSIHNAPSTSLTRHVGEMSHDATLSEPTVYSEAEQNGTLSRKLERSKKRQKQATVKNDEALIHPPILNSVRCNSLHNLHDWTTISGSEEEESEKEEKNEEELKKIEKLHYDNVKKNVVIHFPDIGIIERGCKKTMVQCCLYFKAVQSSRLNYLAFRVRNQTPKLYGMDPTGLTERINERSMKHSLRDWNHNTFDKKSYDFIMKRVAFHEENIDPSSEAICLYYKTVPFVSVVALTQDIAFLREQAQELSGDELVSFEKKYIEMFEWLSKLYARDQLPKTWPNSVRKLAKSIKVEFDRKYLLHFLQYIKKQANDRWDEFGPRAEVFYPIEQLMSSRAKQLVESSHNWSPKQSGDFLISMLEGLQKFEASEEISLFKKFYEFLQKIHSNIIDVDICGFVIMGKLNPKTCELGKHKFIFSTWFGYQR